MDQQIHIASLKRQIEDLGGTVGCGRADLDPDLEASFLERVLAFETAPRSTRFAELTRAGVVMPGPASMDDAEIAGTLTEIIQTLATQRVFLYSTDHLSDRELYTLLITDLLQQETVIMPPDPDSACHLDVLGSGSEEDIHLWLRYYADEADRERWRHDFPGDSIPPHEDPPCNRDARLPGREYY